MCERRLMTNLDIIINQYRPYFNDIYKNEWGTAYTFEGILVAEDDYYYMLLGLNNNTPQMLSCVCDIEDYGFERVER